MSIPQQVSMESQRKEEAMDLSTPAPPTMPALLPVTVSNNQVSEADNVKHTAPGQDALSILAATASLEKANPLKAGSNGSPAISRALKSNHSTPLTIIPETVATETAEPSTPVSIAWPKSTSNTPVSITRPQLTYPAGFMVIPTDQLKNIRMAAPEGAQFVKVIIVNKIEIDKYITISQFLSFYSA